MFYEENKTDSKKRSLYNVYFLSRRFLSVLVLVFMSSFPFFQCNLLLAFSITNLAYMISCQPLKSARANKVEIFNETIIYICCLIMSNFLNVAMPLDLRDLLGWILMGFASLNIVVNIGLTSQESLSDMRRRSKLNKFTKRAQRTLQTKLANREKLMK